MTSFKSKLYEFGDCRPRFDLDWLSYRIEEFSLTPSVSSELKLFMIAGIYYAYYAGRDSENKATSINCNIIFIIIQFNINII